MPLYEYQCDACGKRFEVIQKFSDAAVDACRHCGKGPVQRLFSSPAIQFKGSGWYITDYAKKGSSEGASTKGDAKTDGKTDGTSTGEKPAKAEAPVSTPAKDSSTKE
jgi:putative FmdB family regulatory protein